MGFFTTMRETQKPCNFLPNSNTRQRIYLYKFNSLRVPSASRRTVRVMICNETFEIYRLQVVFAEYEENGWHFYTEKIVFISFGLGRDYTIVCACIPKYRDFEIRCIVITAPRYQ